MSDPYFQQLFADRIGGANYGKGTAIYKFEKIKRAKRKALADHPERKLIDFGIGENDEMAPASIRAALAAEANKPENRGYADNGIAAYKEAVARFMQRNFDVRLDPATEVNHCIGSKTALAILPATLINPGDVTLMTVPGYPVAGTHTKYYGGSVHALPLVAEHGFLPDLDAIPADVLRRAKLLVLCYPNSPTGRLATRDFYLPRDRVCPAAPDRGGAGRGPPDVDLRPAAAELFVGAGGEGGGRRGPLDVEGV